jgi:hypothetical protein
VVVVIVRNVTVRALSMRAVVMCTVIVCTVVVRTVVAARCRLVVVAVGGAAVVSVLGFTGQVVVLIALALVRRAVAFSAGVVIATAHRGIVAVMVANMSLGLGLAFRVIQFVPLLLFNS